MQLLQFSACHIADQRKLQGNKNNTAVQSNHLKVRNTIVFLMASTDLYITQTL